MKISLSASMSFIFITFTTIFYVSIMNFNMTMQKVNAYHYATVHEIESSDFSPYVMNQRVSDATFNTEIINQSITDDLRIYEVKTSARLRIPILGYEQTYVKESIAR